MNERKKGGPTLDFAEFLVLDDKEFLLLLQILELNLGILQFKNGRRGRKRRRRRMRKWWKKGDVRSPGFRPQFACACWPARLRSCPQPEEWSRRSRSPRPQEWLEKTKGRERRRESVGKNEHWYEKRKNERTNPFPSSGRT